MTKHNLIIGGGGGIGRALVNQLRESGQLVTVISRNQESHQGLDARIFTGDARNIDQFDDLAASIHAEQPITGMVCLAGSIILKPAHLTTADEWHDTLALNLTTAFACVRTAGKLIKSDGSVVLTSTVAAGTGLPNHEAIAAAKAGVEGLTRSAAATYASRGLRCNAVAPGLVDTPLAERITRSQVALEHSRKMHPLGRIGTPEDIANAIYWLLSDSSSWMTGQIIGIDGGLGATRATAT
ncbi:MAG: hypothetical protein CMJ39_03440 [Phycisphaerae bacterium]|nr:hypothetical protein [Phycisphaerae bacterium]|tara:strand:- start:311 stop:1030 length:720 start_codon:yes stop_codon:yes gene_type:complete